MMEVLAAGASVIAVIQIIDRIIGLCKFYIKTVRDAPPDLRLILSETSMLKVILENVDFLTACDGPVSAVASNLSGRNGPIVECLRIVTELEKLFPSDGPQTEENNTTRKRQKVKATLTALAWPLKETKARKLIDEMMRFKSTINLALTTESSRDMKEIKGKALEIHDMLTESQRQQVYDWLRPTDPSSLHHQAQKNYEPGTGEWILRIPEWSSWLTGVHRCLRIHGIAGSGKTVLMSHLIEQIRKTCDENPQGYDIYEYYYCYHAHNQDEAKPFLRWMINRLCRRTEYVPEFVYVLYKSGGEPSVQELLQALAVSLERFGTVYIAVDALDESASEGDLLLILQTLVIDSRFKAVQLLTSSRDYIYIERAMAGISSSISMSNPFVKEDIRRYVHSILDKNPRFGRWPRDLLKEVEERLATGAQGMFRWAVCQIDAIQRLKCERKVVQRALEALPKTLNETYDRILLAVPEEDRLFVEHALRWIAHHNKLFSDERISCKVLIQAAEASVLDLTGNHNERFYDEETLREVCGCLIRISHEKDSRDFECPPYNSVEFAHYSVREYIELHNTSGVVDGSPIVGEDLTDRFLKLTILEAQRNESYKCYDPMLPDTGYRDLIEARVVEFGPYCTISVSLSLLQFPVRVSQHDTLAALTIDFFNPSMPHFSKLGDLLADAQGLVESFSYNFKLVSYEWILILTDPVLLSEIDPEVSHQVALLLLVECYSEYSPPVRKFLEGKDISRLTQAPWHPGNKFLDNTDESEKYTFKDTIIKRFARGAMDGSRDPFRILIELTPGLLDSSVVLLLYIGAHHSEWEAEECKDSCLVERLLKLGADPNKRCFRVNPLQIAVLYSDVEGVKLLLKAGALPNDVGNPDGVELGVESSDMSRFNYLHGASPLRICRDIKIYRNLRTRVLPGDTESRWEMIAALLLQHGAEDYPTRTDLRILDSKTTSEDENDHASNSNEVNTM